ncbi:hypothetical protein R6V09_04035 [Streptomyces sp. W16]|uniref:hypothetical protein n=1 Tax=Streptomyces sp. W16 TaxID=3076631 RepID=UPI00295BF2FD|nr:hypothetical protein [Streptomyces sp. W16]MDV9169310.1 hypothetical protein [Streptomyces sp. W16]
MGGNAGASAEIRSAMPAEGFARHGVRFEVVRRSDGRRGFVVLARRGWWSAR